MKIAIIEDDSVVSSLLKEQLVEDGHEVMHVKNLQSFEALLRLFTPELIITDIMLNGVTPRELMDYFTEFDCPIFVISSMDQEDIAFFADAINASAFFQKPLQIASLTCKLGELIN